MNGKIIAAVVEAVAGNRFRQEVEETGIRVAEITATAGIKIAATEVTVITEMATMAVTEARILKRDLNSDYTP